MNRIAAERITSPDPSGRDYLLGFTALGNLMNSEKKIEVARGIEPDVTIEILRDRYEPQKPTTPAWVVRFHELPEGVTAYNASQVFNIGEDPHVIVREEGARAEDEYTSRLAIYRVSEDGRDCYPAPVSNLAELTAGKVAQDPAIAYVNGKWVVTWVEVEPVDPKDPTKGGTYKSVIALGDGLNSLERMVETTVNADGVEEKRPVECPDTKCLRFAGLLDGRRIGITTRTLIDGIYRLKFRAANSWEDITSRFLAEAQAVKGLEGLIVNSENKLEQRWTGINNLVLLPNGELSTLFHGGEYIDNGIPDFRVYDALHCVLTPDPGDGPAQARHPKIIARAKDLQIPLDELPPKRADLPEVLYPSCILFDRLGRCILLTAARDSGELGQELPDPLKEWREENPQYAGYPMHIASEQLAPAA